MKRILSFILVLATTLTLCLSLASCENENEIEIKYGKKYIIEHKSKEGDSKRYEAIIFNKDGTGTYEYFYNYDSKNDEDDYTKSGTVSFVWEKTSDGAIHMFETDVKYNKDHTDGKKIYAIKYPLYFSENMVYYSYVSGSQYSTITFVSKYLLEGSDLYNETYNKD